MEHGGTTLPGYLDLSSMALRYQSYLETRPGDPERVGRPIDLMGPVIRFDAEEELAVGLPMWAKLWSLLPRAVPSLGVELAGRVRHCAPCAGPSPHWTVTLHLDPSCREELALFCEQVRGRNPR